MWESGNYLSYLSICLTRKISRAGTQSTMTQVLLLGLCFEAVALRRLACDGQRCWKPSATSRFLNSLMRSLAGKKSGDHQLRFGTLSSHYLRRLFSLNLQKAQSEASTVLQVGFGPGWLVTCRGVSRLMTKVFDSGEEKGGKIAGSFDPSSPFNPLLILKTVLEIRPH